MQENGIEIFRFAHHHRTGLYGFLIILFGNYRAYLCDWLGDKMAPVFLQLFHKVHFRGTWPGNNNTGQKRLTVKLNRLKNFTVKTLQKISWEK